MESWKSSGRFLAIKSWASLCFLKKDGGLGFRKNKDFNHALLSKLDWMMASSRESVCMDMLRNKYMVKEDWLRNPPPKIASSVWKAIENAKVG